MKWTQSLIRLANHEVEELQKRLAGIAARRVDAELRLTLLKAQAEVEDQLSQQDSASAHLLGRYRQAVKPKAEHLRVEIELVLAEEAGARYALTEAFEVLKKYERVAETQRLVRVADLNRRESAQLDELGLRRSRTP